MLENQVSQMNRRQFYQRLGYGALCSGLVGGLATPSIASKNFSFEDVRQISLVNSKTDERFSGTYYEYGTYLPEVMDKLDYLLRDHKADEVMIMDVRLIDFLSAIKNKIDRHELVITSAYRTKKTNADLRRRNYRAAKNSLHMYGMAVDFYSPSLSWRSLSKIASAEKRGGVGTYRRANFIHVDVGEVRTWRR